MGDGPLKIAIDWDGTFTGDPELWSAFIKEAVFRGHDVAFVTGRNKLSHYHPYKGMDSLEDTAKHLGVPVIYTEGQQKQDVYGADVWIDDRPDAVVGHHQVHTLLEQGYIKLNKD